MISVGAISKIYNHKEVLKKISFEVSKGEIFGLIGPDSAGKTTLLQILSTLILPHKGTAQINGWDLIKEWRKIRKIIGYMSENFSLYPDLTVEENLSFSANIFGKNLSQNSNLIQDIYAPLQPFKDRRAGNLSGGMKKKLSLCCALIHQPVILLLDEPTMGLDPIAQSDFWNNLQKIKQEGVTILISTSRMQEAEHCTKIALLNEGELLGLDTLDNIKNKFNKILLSLYSSDMYGLLNMLKKCTLIDKVYTFGATHHVIINSVPSLSNNQKTIEKLKKYLQQHQQGVEIKEIAPTIEDCFMDLVQLRKESII